MEFDQDRDRDFNQEIADRFENKLPLQYRTIMSPPPPADSRRSGGSSLPGGQIAGSEK